MITLGLLISTGAYFLANFRQLVKPRPKMQEMRRESALVTPICMSADADSAAAETETYTQESSFLPRTVTNQRSHRITASDNICHVNVGQAKVTVVAVHANEYANQKILLKPTSGESEPHIYQTIQSATRFSIVTPESSLYNKSHYTPASSLTSISSKRHHVTIQPLLMQTPLPPRIIRCMSTRGGERFDQHLVGRPAQQRLAVQYLEGCDITDNGETGEPWFHSSDTTPLGFEHISRLNSPKDADVADKLGHSVLSQKPRSRLRPDSEISLEQVRVLEHLVAKRIRRHHLQRMEPLALAIHNNLAHMINSKGPRMECYSVLPALKQTRRRSSQSEHNRLRRNRTVIKPLDLAAAHVYQPTSSLENSPPESPEPTTPVDESSQSLSTDSHVMEHIRAWSGEDMVSVILPRKEPGNLTQSRGRSMTRSSQIF